MAKHHEANIDASAGPRSLNNSVESPSSGSIVPVCLCKFMDTMMLQILPVPKMPSSGGHPQPGNDAPLLSLMT